MYRPYIAYIDKYFPEAISAVDSFHVVKHINSQLDRKADYDKEDATVAALKDLIDGLLEVGGETKGQREENVPKVLDALKALTPEKTMQDIYTSGLSDTELEAELEKNGYDGNIYPLSQVAGSYPNIKFTESIQGTNHTGDTKVQIYPVGPLQRLDDFVAGDNGGNTDSLRELLKVCIAYPYYIETRAGHEVNYRFTQVRTGQTAEESKEALDEMYKALLGQRLSNEYGWETAAAYTEDKFRGDSEAELRAMIERIRDEYKTAIENAAWMSEATKANALNKLEHMEYDLFGPNDYEAYTTDQDLKTAGEGGTLFTNIKAYNTGKWNSLSKWIDNDYYRKDCYWRNLYGNITPTGEMTPLFPNGSYEPKANCIAIWAGLLDKEMYDPGQAIYNYGRVGAAIAHEIGHGFDSNGMQYDDKGDKKSIIAPEDVDKWDAKCSQLAKIFSNYSIYYDPDTEQFFYADGKTELPEIMSDVGGDEIVTAVVQKDLPGDENLKQLYSTLCMLWNTVPADAGSVL